MPPRRRLSLHGVGSGDRLEHRITLRRVWDSLDRDGSGAVSKAELLEVLRDNAEVRTFLHVEHFETAAADDLFASMDADSDGSIEWHEFMAYLRMTEGPHYPSIPGVDDKPPASAMRYSAGKKKKKKATKAGREESKGEDAAGSGSSSGKRRETKRAALSRRKLRAAASAPEACSVTDCPEPKLSRGYCAVHFEALVAPADALAPPPPPSRPPSRPPPPPPGR
eukprot:PLAT497.1.p1 GENE.PLAT497.1~~PLAT497.1.p1  ORF type:complete len:223 (-),score=86.91 PLAT497.1:69-737(-)